MQMHQIDWNNQQVIAIVSSNWFSIIISPD